jgi:predicted MFS family arabinose efflux permease
MPEAAPGAVARWAIAVVGFCAMLNLYAPQAILPTLAQVFGVAPVAAGLTITATTLAVALCGPMAGAMGDLLGRKRVIIGALVLLAIPTVASGFTTTLPQLVVTRFVQGLFMPAAFAAALGYIGEEWGRQGIGRTMSLYIASNVGGGFAGRMIGGLAANLGNWRACFFALAVINLCGAALVWQLLPAPRHAAQLRPHGVIGVGAAGAGVAGIGRSVRAILANITNRRLLSAYFVGFNVLFGLTAIFTYVNFYLSRPPFSLSPAMLGMVFGVYLIGLVATPVAGRWIDRVGQRRMVLLATLLSCIGCVITLVARLPIVIAGLALFCTGAFICQSAATSYVGLMAGANRSSAAGLYLSFYYMGGAVGSLFGGYAWAWGGWTACVVIAVLVQAMMAAIATKLWVSSGRKH